MSTQLSKSRFLPGVFRRAVVTHKPWFGRRIWLWFTGRVDFRWEMEQANNKRERDKDMAVLIAKAIAYEFKKPNTVATTKEFIRMRDMANRPWLWAKKKQS